MIINEQIDAIIFNPKIYWGSSVKKFKYGGEFVSKNTHESDLLQNFYNKIAFIAL